MAHRPPRLERVFDCYDPALFFVTFNTRQRQRLLDRPPVHERLRTFAAKAAEQEIALGRYVLMPDHVHLFVAGPRTFDLAAWVRILKLSLSAAIDEPRPHWQEGFFDRLLRREESYAQKWDYVRMNPVRAGLVREPEAWPFQGEFMALPFK